MVLIPAFERPPALKAMLPCGQFLRIAEFESFAREFRHPAVTGQARADLRRDQKVPTTMPAQDQLGLLPEVFDIGHGRTAIDVAWAVNA